MTSQHLNAARMTMRLFCAVGELFSATDIYGNAINTSGHRFIRTPFKIKVGSSERRLPIYYCRCDQIAISHTETILGLADDGSERELTLCTCLEHDPKPEN